MSNEVKIEKPKGISMSMCGNPSYAEGFNQAVNQYEAWKKQEAEKQDKFTICCLGKEHPCMLQVNDGYCCAETCQYQVKEYKPQQTEKLDEIIYNLDEKLDEIRKNGRSVSSE